MQRRPGALLAAFLCAFAGRAVAQGGDSLPPGVTPELVSEGARLFRGQGLCVACHGAAGAGTIGPSLADSVWLHSTGSYDELVRQITTGVTAKESTSGVVMPPKGGGNLSEAQVKAVAAYVWKLSHPATP